MSALPGIELMQPSPTKQSALTNFCISQLIFNEEQNIRYSFVWLSLGLTFWPEQD